MQELSGVGMGEMDEAIARAHVGLDWTPVVKLHGTFDYHGLEISTNLTDWSTLLANPVANVPIITNFRSLPPD